MPIGNYYIAVYDSAWPRRFAEEKPLILDCLGLEPGRLEHVGSTAVPGLGAKPIIDLMLGVDLRPSMGTAAQVLAALKTLGYACDGTETVPGTLYCPKTEPYRFNLHLTKYQGAFWVDHLLFRDHLCFHKDVAEAYDALKRGILAGMGAEPDRAAYNNQKSDFILKTLEEARAWKV